MRVRTSSYTYNSRINWFEALPACVLSVAFYLLLPPASRSSEMLNKGIAAYNSGDYVRAVQLLCEAKQRDFENSSLHYYLGSAYVKLRRNQQAIQEFKVALDLNPEGKVADYCRASLSMLSPAPVKPVVSKEKVSEPPKVEKIQQPRAQQPVVYAYVDGSPASDHVIPVLTDLQSQCGDKINFARGHKGADANKTLLSSYKVTECPAVLLFDNQGKMIKKFEGVILEELLRKDVLALGSTTDLTRHPSTEDKTMAMSRKAIVDEYNTRVADGRRQLESEIKMARREVENEMLMADATLDFSDSRVKERVESRANAKTARLQAEFKKRKLDWYEFAKKRLELLGIKGSATELANPVDGAD